MESHPSKGAVIAFPERANSAAFAKISYAKDIAPIIQAKCATCHQPGGIGPMPLNNYTQIKGFSPMIREVIRTHRMPPYLADETVGQFKDDDRLSPQQMKTLVHWIDAGAQRGNGDDPLQKISFKAPEWPLGKPDVVLSIPAVKVPASGVLDYTHPVVPMTLPEGRWMKATTFRVTDRQVVHHILSGTVNPDHKGDTFSESQWGASLGGYGPGRGSNIQPVDTGVWVPAAGGVGFQNHYTPYGKETEEKTQMGLYFYPKGQEPKYRQVLHLMGATNAAGVDVPPNSVKQTEGFFVMKENGRVESFQPHMHLRGKAMEMTAILPTGQVQVLSKVSDFNFNWMTSYFYADDAAPLLPKGTIIKVTAWHDNTSANKNNPDPNVWVGYGDRTVDEMAHAWVNVTYMGDADFKSELDARRAAKTKTTQQQQQH
jgi:hypothetical protein